MSRASKKIIAAAVEALNEAIDSDPRAEVILNTQHDGLTAIDLINNILAAAAEGATIVAARETDGSLVGFVPKRTKIATQTNPEGETEGQPETLP
jgi:hypothetical protein